MHIFIFLISFPHSSEFLFYSIHFHIPPNILFYPFPHSSKSKSLLSSNQDPVPRTGPRQVVLVPVASMVYPSSSVQFISCVGLRLMLVDLLGCTLPLKFVIRWQSDSVKYWESNQAGTKQLFSVYLLIIFDFRL